ncbi:uncharacterized protein LOC143281153 [Babylonia areolata]|uniref:uncharacterized protein LOC143281153 n=1 Tax=Babylonia areolata TaxID=304850 RepID=UPI003FD3C63F
MNWVVGTKWVTTDCSMEVWTTHSMEEAVRIIVKDLAYGRKRGEECERHQKAGSPSHQSGGENWGISPIRMAMGRLGNGEREEDRILLPYSRLQKKTLQGKRQWSAAAREDI